MKAFKPKKALADLREAVFCQSTKRLPIWRFRLASDLVLQLQPQAAFVIGRAPAL